jgi:hypothetical protein
VTAQDGNDDETVYMNLQFFGTIEPRLAWQLWWSTYGQHWQRSLVWVARIGCSQLRQMAGDWSRRSVLGTRKWTPRWRCWMLTLTLDDCCCDDKWWTKTKQKAENKCKRGICTCDEKTHKKTVFQVARMKCSDHFKLSASACTSAWCGDGVLPVNVRRCWLYLDTLVLQYWVQVLLLRTILEKIIVIIAKLRISFECWHCGKKPSTNKNGKKGPA